MTLLDVWIERVGRLRSGGLVYYFRTLSGRCACEGLLADDKGQLQVLQVVKRCVGFP
jgi:hypothetical protein